MGTKKPEGRWALCWDHCQKCGGTDRAHMAKGLCTRCWKQEQKAGTLGNWRSVPAPQEVAVSKIAPRWHYQYVACKGCGTTTRPHHSNGQCTECVMLAQGVHPGKAARVIEDMKGFGVPLAADEEQRLKGVLARKYPEGHTPVTILPTDPIVAPPPAMPARDTKAEPAHGGPVKAAGLARLDAEYQKIVARPEPERGGLVNPANPPPAWVFREQERDRPVPPMEMLTVEIAPGLSVPLGEQIGGLVDEQGEPMPTEPAQSAEYLTTEEVPIYNEVRYLQTASPEPVARLIVPYDGPDRNIALADFTAEELLAEINTRFAAMQGQWQDALEVSRRYARIAAIMEGK